MLRELPSARVIASEDIVELIESALLYGLGIGFVDAQLLACVKATFGLTLGTRDARRFRAALYLGCAYHTAPD